MSFVPGQSAGVGDVASALRQMIEQMLFSAFITSPRFQDYKIEAVDINTADFSGIIDEAIRVSVIRFMEDQGITAGGISADPTQTGFSESDAVGLARQGVAKFRDPVSLVSEALPFLPHTVVIGFAISLMPFIIQELTKPGGPFDLRFKRRVEEEFNALQDRQTTYDLRIGHRGLIIQNNAGFMAHNQTGATSTTDVNVQQQG